MSISEQTELDLVPMFKALGDPTRLQIFAFLRSCCCPVAVEETGEQMPHRFRLAKCEQRSKVIAVVNGDEGTECVDAFAGQNFQVAMVLHGDASFICVWHRNWK